MFYKISFVYYISMNLFRDLLYVLLIYWFGFLLPISSNLYAYTQIYIFQIFTQFLTGAYLKWNIKIPRG